MKVPVTLLKILRTNGAYFTIPVIGCGL